MKKSRKVDQNKIDTRKEARQLLKQWKQVKSNKDSDELLVDMIAEALYGRAIETTWVIEKYNGLLYFLATLPETIKKKLQTQAAKELKSFKNKDGEWGK